MRSINYLIVELDEAYNNEETISTGDSVIINSTIESVANINRVATVVEAPNFTILKKGDKVVVHHNIFRLKNSTRGNVVESDYFIEDNKYFVPLTEIFMYKNDSGWIALDPYCFVEPIVKEVEDTSGFSLSPTEGTYKGRLDRIGIIRYPSKELLSQGVKVGDKVKFSKNSEYEFILDGKVFYKMSSKDILAVL